jgi:hypothetical protein
MFVTADTVLGGTIPLERDTKENEAASKKAVRFFRLLFPLNVTFGSNVDNNRFFFKPFIFFAPFKKLLN